MTAITYLLDHAGDIATVMAILGAVVFPALSRIARVFGDGPKATAASKFFDGLGLDLAKSGRALASLKAAAPTVDELARDINAPPADEDTDKFIRRTEGKK